MSLPVGVGDRSALACKRSCSSFAVTWSSGGTSAVVLLIEGHLETYRQEGVTMHPPSPQGQVSTPGVHRQATRSLAFSKREVVFYST